MEFDIKEDHLSNMRLSNDDSISFIFQVVNFHGKAFSVRTFVCVGMNGF